MITPNQIDIIESLTKEIVASNVALQNERMRPGPSADQSDAKIKHYSDLIKRMRDIREQLEDAFSTDYDRGF